jgi:hypothetical protein
LTVFDEDEGAERQSGDDEEAENPRRLNFSPQAGS